MRKTISSRRRADLSAWMRRVGRAARAGALENVKQSSAGAQHKIVHLGCFVIKNLRHLLIFFIYARCASIKTHVKDQVVQTPKSRNEQASSARILSSAKTREDIVEEPEI